MTRRSLARGPAAIEFAQDQRATANEFAHTVWQWVRNRQIGKQKFRREYPIPPYTVDFCCVELKLIVEIDGADHQTETGRERDQTRDAYLAKLGFRVVRILGYDILREPTEAYRRIEESVYDRVRELTAAAG